MRRARWVIIGAGLAGSVLAKALGAGAVLLDPAPGSYKIGESVIPEQFHSPLMADLLDEIQTLPSWAAKLGTTFVDVGGAADHGAAGGPMEVASFPLAHHSERSLHVLRTELESLIHRRFALNIVRERVQQVDLERRTVVTDKGTWQSEGPILDCSGPAMAVATQLGEVAELWPVWASWAYADAEADDDAFWRSAGDAPVSHLDVPSGRLLRVQRGTVPPTKTTLLTRVDDGLWLWQIPLYRGHIVSVGVVSRAGPVTPAQHQAIVAKHGAACWRLTPRDTSAAQRARDERRFGRALSADVSKHHERAGFARHATRAASVDHVLLGDAAAFADPVYSVGTGLAVAQALRLAAQLKCRPWTAESAARWDTDMQRAFAQARRAFDFWYSGQVLRDEAAATTVQHNYLIGSGFRRNLLGAYTTMIADANRQASATIGDRAAGLLGDAFASARIEANPSEGSVSVQLSDGLAYVHPLPPDGRAWHVVADGIGLSYRGPTPPRQGGALAAQVAAEPRAWAEMLADVWAMRPRGQDKGAGDA